MQENIAELSRKYREEMMRLYGAKQASAAPAAQPQAIIPPPQLDIDEEEVLELASEVSAPEQNAPEEIPQERSEEPAAEETIPEKYEEPVLPDYIRSEPPQIPADWTAQEEYEKRNTAEGRLRVVAATARSAYPVAGARVMVYTRIGGKDYLNYVLTTDLSGETPTVTLPAPPASLSQDPGNEAPYAVCDIDIFATGFFHSEARGVHIFAGITTRQVFQLIPLPLNVREADLLRFDPDGQLREEES